MPSCGRAIKAASRKNPVPFQKGTGFFLLGIAGYVKKTGDAFPTFYRSLLT